MSRVLSNVKRASAMVQSFTTGHSELSMAIYGEKCVAEAQDAVIRAKAEAMASWVKWAEQEEPGPIREMYLQLAEVDQLWVQLHQHFAEQYEEQRKVYKQILKGEQTVDGLKKQHEDVMVRVKKLQKQVDESIKKKDKKLAQHKDELAKAIGEEGKIRQMLETRQANHAVFKFTKSKEILKPIFTMQQELHEKCLEIARARHSILTLYTNPNFYSITPDMVAAASVESTNIINDLAARINIERKERKDSKERTESATSDIAVDALHGHNVTGPVYQGVPDAECDEDIVDPAQRPLPPVPNVPSRRAPAPPEELYDYISADHLPAAPIPEEEPTYLQPLPDPDYDNDIAVSNEQPDNVYMPMERSGAADQESVYQIVQGNERTIERRIESVYVNTDM